MEIVEDAIIPVLVMVSATHLIVVFAMSTLVHDGKALRIVIQGIVTTHVDCFVIREFVHLAVTGG
jgi:hypothetical protein